MKYALLGSLVWYSAFMALVLLELGDAMMKGGWRFPHDDV